MYDSLFRHVVTLVITGAFAMMFWGGYVAGANGWWVLWLVLLPVYIFVYSLFGEGH